jgi:hypothetical protein
MEVEVGFSRSAGDGAGGGDLVSVSDDARQLVHRDGLSAHPHPRQS